MDLIGFALAVLLVELTPGPNMAWLAGLAATEGRRTGMAAVLGVAIGLAINGALAALGLVAIMQAQPHWLGILRIAGAAMMAWLALDAWRESSRASATRAKPPGTRRAFATGTLVNLLNPKAYIFFVVVAPQFSGGRTLGLDEALVLTAISVCIATAIHTAIVVAGSSFHGWLADPARTRMVRRIFAIVMLAVAASFLIAARQT